MTERVVAEPGRPDRSFNRSDARFRPVSGGMVAEADLRRIYPLSLTVAERGPNTACLTVLFAFPDAARIPGDDRIEVIPLVARDRNLRPPRID